MRGERLGRGGRGLEKEQGEGRTRELDKSQESRRAGSRYGHMEERGGGQQGSSGEREVRTRTRTRPYPEGQGREVGDEKEEGEDDVSEYMKRKG